MCQTVLRVSYIRKDVVTVLIERGGNVQGKITEFMENQQVVSVEVFEKTQDLRKEVKWVDKMRWEDQGNA